MSLVKSSRKSTPLVSIAKEAARYQAFRQKLTDYTGHTVVIGDGWSALFSAWLKLSEGQAVTWIAGTGSYLVPPLAGIETHPDQEAKHGSPSQVLRQWVQEALPGLDLGRLDSGCFIREFRNKSFRPPVWVKPLDAQARFDSRKEYLWEEESRLGHLFEDRFEKDLWSVQDLLRESIIKNSAVFRLEGLPVQEVLLENEKSNATPDSLHKKVVGVVIGSGLKAMADHVIFADRLPSLFSIVGMPRPLPLMRGREASSVMQAVFEHEGVTPEISANWTLGQTYMTELHRDAGEDFNRHVWGYFVATAKGYKSVWSVVLQASEVEDNHEIAKKLRRMKQALDRVFEGPAEATAVIQAKFSNTISNEQLRFEEASLLFKGEEPKKALHLKDWIGADFLTDGYGVASSLLQAAHLSPAFLSRAFQSEVAAQEQVPGLLTQGEPVLESTSPPEVSLPM